MELTPEEAVVSAIQYVRISEQVRERIVQLTHVVVGLQELSETDSELGPELAAALEGINIASEALQRLHVFASARLDAMLNE